MARIVIDEVTVSMDEQVSVLEEIQDCFQDVFHDFGFLVEDGIARGYILGGDEYVAK